MKICRPLSMAKILSRLWAAAQLIVVDGAEMGYTNLDQGQRHAPVAVTDMRLHLLSEGFRYDLVSRKVEFPKPAATNDI